MAKVLMEEMSWFEIKEAMENGCDTVILCAASHEQHGPHLAESTDYIIVFIGIGRPEVDGDTETRG